MSLYLTQSLHRAISQHPFRLATVCGDRRQNFAQLGDRVARLAAVLRKALAIGPNDRVAMLALNSDRHIEYFLACFWAGAIACPLNTRWSVSELQYGIEDSGARVLLFDDHGRAAALSLRSQLARELCLVYIGDGDTPDGALRYEQLFAVAEPIEDSLRSGTDAALLLYTGGTTGFPKGVLLSHENMGAASLAVAAFGCSTGNAMLHAVPLFHMAGVQMLFCHLLQGGTSVVVPAFQPRAVIDIIINEKISSTMLVPTMLQMVVQEAESGRHDLSQLQFLFYGAAPISEALLQRAMALMPQTGFVQGYGMTETCLALMLPALDHSARAVAAGRLRSAGLPLPTVELKIVDREDREQPHGVPGEIVVRGPSVMGGYWQQPEASANSLRGGWMHTGDVAYRDDDGYVYIVDRLKDMIISGGENVYSNEVENVLAQHSLVAACAVIGVPDPKWGERVHAVVVCKPETSAPVESLEAHCRERMAAYKCPRSFEFRDALPLSPAGKVLKTVLREPFWKGVTRAIS